MPANLTAEAKAKWNKAQQARTPKDKIQALQEFLSAIPKHKGNERLRAQTKRKIALLKTELHARRMRGSGTVSERVLGKAGAAQVAIVGMTNVGRSSLLAAVSRARPAIAAYPYTTKECVPGMLQFEDLQLQLVELPALVPGEGETYVLQEGSADYVRNCDGLIIMVDLSDQPLVQFNRIAAELARYGVAITRQESNVSIMKTRAGGMQIVGAGRLVDSTREDVELLLRSYAIPSVVVRLTGDVRIEDIEDVILETKLTYKPAIVIANKADLTDAAANRELFGVTEGKIQVLVTSCVTGLGLRDLGRRLFQVLDIMRVYTKEPNSSAPSPDPFVIRRGATVGDLSRQIHTALFRQFKYARVWGNSVSYPGERVGVDHVLFDGDAVEIHA